MARKKTKLKTTPLPELAEISIWRKQCAGLCFLVLGGLAAIQQEGGFDQVVFGIVLGAIFGLGVVAIVGRLAKYLNRELVQKHGEARFNALLYESSLMLIPFTVLAVLSKMFFGWNAAIPFSSAALVGFGATFGVALGKLGDTKRIPLLVVTGGTPFCLGVVWTFLISLLR